MEWGNVNSVRAVDGIDLQDCCEADLHIIGGGPSRIVLQVSRCQSVRYLYGNDQPRTTISA